MTAPTLSRVTLETLENYTNAATATLVAYRLGSQRLVGLVNGTLENSVYPRTAKLAPRTTQRLDQARGQVSDLVVKGIARVTERSVEAVERGSAVAAAQWKKAARFAAGIDNETLASGLQTAARLALPGAQVALVVSGKLAEGAQALAGAAGARKPRAAAKKAARKATRKAAPAARKAVAKTPRVRKAVQAETAAVAAVAAPARKRRASRVAPAA